MAEMTRDRVERMLGRIGEIGDEAKEDLLEDILLILSDEVERIALTPRERADILALIKGRYSTQAFFNALQVATRVLEGRREAVREIPERIEREIKFGVELVPSMDLSKVVDYTRRFELGGMDHIWITDHYTNRDPYVTLALLAKATYTANLGVGVTNPYTRHPASTASAIASLDEASDNRAVLGLGPGDKATLSPLGIEMERPLAKVRETVGTIRALWRGEEALSNAKMGYTPSREIPIYIGAQGPKMLKLAGEIGDGVLINASHEKDFEFATGRIKDGIEKAGKKTEDVDVVAYTCFSVAEDEEEAFKAVSPVVAFIAAGSPDAVLERHGLDLEKAAQIRNLLEKGKMKDAFGLVDESFVDVFSLTGTPEQIIDKISNLTKAGVTQVVIGSPMGKKKKEALPLIVDKVLPAFT